MTMDNRETAGDMYVNGGWIEPKFFVENFREANETSWTLAQPSAIDDHTHCLICQVTLTSNSKEKIYTSGFSYLCNFCYSNFILEK